MYLRTKNLPFEVYYYQATILCSSCRSLPLAFLLSILITKEKFIEPAEKRRRPNKIKVKWKKLNPLEILLEKLWILIGVEY